MQARHPMNAAVAAFGLSLLIFMTGLPAQAPAHCDKPSLLVVLDRSSSMVEYTVPTGETRWAAARAALSLVFGTFGDDIDFGLMVFPYPDGCAPGRVVIDIGPGTEGDILDTLAVPPPPSPANSTPMAETLEEAADYAPLMDASKRRAVVLVTDGREWCYPYDPATRFTPVDAAAAVRATGAGLHVIGFGGEGVDALVLNRIAQESGTSLPGCNPESQDPLAADNCYHVAGDAGSLITALDSIARRITEEACDGLDNDCDGSVDEDLTESCATACGSGLQLCEGGSWTACSAPVPSAEVCDGVADEDCDGVVDEGCACVDGDERACGVDEGECEPGTQRCLGGAWGGCEGATGPLPERCNGVDDNCEGHLDEGCDCLDGETRVCGLNRGVCEEGLSVCVDGRWGECEGAAAPSAEVCDGLDNDCNGTVDDGAPCAEGEACFLGECVPEIIHEAPGCGCVAAGGKGSARLPLTWLGLMALLAVALAFGPRRRP